MEQTTLRTATETLINNGLNWRVVSSPIYDNNGRELKGFKAIQREDSGLTFQ